MHLLHISVSHCRLVVLTQDGCLYILRTRTAYFVPSRPAPGSWQSVLRALSGPWPVGNTVVNLFDPVKICRANMSADLMPGWNKPLPIGRSAQSIIHPQERVRGSSEKGLAGYLPSAGIARQRWVCGPLAYIPSSISPGYGIIKLPTPRALYHQILYCPTILPYPTSKRPHCHLRIYRWQTISGDEGSDNLAKLFWQPNISIAT